MPAVPRPVDVWHNVDQTIFLNDIKARGRPAVLKAVAIDWPAVAAGHESPRELADYLLRFANSADVLSFEGAPEIEGRIFYNDALDGFNFTPHNGPLAPLLDRLIADMAATKPPTLYAGSLPIPVHFPGFNQDNTLASLIPASKITESLWIGNRTRIAAHYDTPENLACVVAGRRRFTLFPTDQYNNLYIGPPDFSPAGQAISLVDFHHPDFETFPRFAQALEAALVAELEPGDAIYIPSLWWHHVASLTPFSVLANSWWRDVPAYFGSPHDSLLHAVLALKDLPPAQREAWKAVFNHLVFQCDGPPLAHLPEHTHGLHGAPSPEKAAYIRALLTKNLSR